MTEHEYHPAIEWTPVLDEMLREARVSQRLSWKRAGRLMGIAPDTCHRRAKRLGFGAPLRRLGVYTPEVEAEILRRRAASETFRMIADSLGLNHTDVWRHYQNLTRNASPEVRHGPDGRAAALHSAVSADLDVPPETGAVLLKGSAASLSEQSK